MQRRESKTRYELEFLQQKDECTFKPKLHERVQYQSERSQSSHKRRAEIAVQNSLDRMKKG